MKFDINPDTLAKLREIYEAQWGDMPSVLVPTWYLVRPQSFDNYEKSTKIRFLLDYLENNDFKGDYDILDNGDLLLCAHYCRIEHLELKFGKLTAIPLAMDLEDLSAANEQ